MKCFVQFSATQIQTSPRGTDAFVTLLSGYQNWILIPTNEKKDLERITCSKECQAGSWIKNIFPQLKENNFEIFGEHLVQVLLKPEQVFLIFLCRPMFFIN